MSFYEQWGTLAVLVVAGCGLYAAATLVNRLLRPTVPAPLKLSTYECGVEAVGTGWSQMNIRYYVFAFLFVIFDVESVFLFPWAVIVGGLDENSVISPTFAVVEMFIFIGILAIGLVYAWRKKVLVWE
ncbi:MAG: NADH-quinone oxidoreductase subunit A [Nitriliruptorales bacterium]|nr:NADH-quinone oxidoreductase subunit A [Nitriliruptorales bacterium]